MRTTKTGTQYVIKKAANGATDGYELSLATSGYAFVRFNQKTSSNTYRVDAVTPYLQNTWFHLAATYDGTTTKLFIDGVLNASGSGPAAIVSNNLPLGIGAESTLVSPLSGNIDDARIYNRALSEGEIAALASTTPPGDETSPAIPTGLSAVASDAVVDLDWDANSDADLAGYNLYRSETSPVDSSGSPLNGGILITAESYSDSSVVNETLYYYSLTSVDTSGNESDGSAETSATPVGDVTAPDAPSGLSAVGGDGVVALNWDDNSEGDLAGYNVYRGTETGVYDPTPINGGSLIADSDYLDSSVANGTPYFYVVTAVDLSDNESILSGEASATPEADTTPPAAPTNLSAAAGDGEVDLNWDDNGEPDLAGYNVYRGTTSGSFDVTPINGGSLVSASQYNDTAVTNGTEYFYVVKAGDLSSNESLVSNEASATPVHVSTPYDLAFNPYPTVNQYVTFGQATSTLGVQQFTLEVWVKRSATGGKTMGTGTGGLTNMYPVLTKGMGEGESPANVNMNFFLGVSNTGLIGADFEDTVNWGKPSCQRNESDPHR